MKGVAGAAPVLVGSGADERTIARHLSYPDGSIIGTAFQRDGKSDNPVDADRVARITNLVR